tara:strand:+ start:3933 stop:5459 length:1527 start_codon:yes stop_codon:yes gene_type:complete
MCAIAGIIGPKINKISKMISVQKHRGPDEQNFKSFSNKISLGMARLSIMDLKSKNLCLYQEKNHILTYNGEIYNFNEIKQELKQKGIKFYTNCDTEVFLKSFIFWGRNCFSKFNGMFAAGIYDLKKEKLFLVRDIAGEKPLYYYKKNRNFAFASEAKAFHKNFELSKNLNRKFFNTFQHCLNKTLWNEVFSLAPATIMEVDVKSLNITKNKYWSFKKRHINLKTATEELESLLKKSTKLRTKSDVPYGLYFSGGIDSSLISTFHNFKYKFYFDNKKNHKKEFYKEIKKIAWHLDFPVGSLSSYPLWKLAKLASKKIKVILSGEGADEIFGGYVRYIPIAAEYNLKLKFPSYKNYLFNKYFKYKNYLDGFAKITARDENSFEFTREKLKPYFEMFDDPINAMGYADFDLIMPSLLQMGDRMSSAFSIENRCPFLDKDVIEFGFSLPYEYKVKNLSQKNILRVIANKRGLTNATKMEKKGLIIKYNKWENREDWDRSYYFNFLKKNSVFV